MTGRLENPAFQAEVYIDDEDGDDVDEEEDGDDDDDDDDGDGDDEDDGDDFEGAGDLSGIKVGDFNPKSLLFAGDLTHQLRT